MANPRCRRRALTRGTGLVVGLCLVALGCGLTDYEKHMDEEHAFLRDFDEENKFLGDPLEMPLKWVMRGKFKQQEEAVPGKFFLRPPKGFAARSKEGETFPHERVTLYRFPRAGGENLLFTAAELNKNPLTGGEIKTGIAPKDFRAQVRGALVQFVLKEHKLFMNSWAGEDNLKRIPYPVKNLHGRPGILEFDGQAFTDKPADAKDEAKHRLLEAYYLIDSIYQAAIIFDMPVPKSRDPNARKAIELSLRSVVLGPEAFGKVQEYVMRSRRPQSTGPLPVINSNDLK
jgi:hypothetical protein